MGDAVRGSISSANFFLIRKTGVFLQDVREILRKGNDEGANCPRCRGSGLLNLHSTWHAASNAPCLFCEGVGVMPIVGLRGYMIGRTVTTLIVKQGIESRPIVPDDVHHNRARSSTKISTNRHCKIQSQFLYNPLSNPVWLLEAQREASLTKSSQEEAAEHFSDHRDSDDPSPVGLIGLDQAGWRYRHRFYARASAPFSNPTATSQADDTDSWVKQGQAADGSLQGSDLRGVGVAVADLDSHSHVRSSSQDSKKRVKSSPRGPRSSRRLRNRIREKAEKEAETRARRFQIKTSEASCEIPLAHSWNPLLRMCRSLMLLTAPDPKKPLVQEISGNIADAA